MTKCFVKSCKNSDRNLPSGVTFHKIPKQLTKEWLEAICRPAGTFLNNQRICSEHFRQNDFNSYGQLKTLKEKVIPSLNLPATHGKAVAVGSATAPRLKEEWVASMSMVGKRSFSDTASTTSLITRMRTLISINIHNSSTKDSGSRCSSSTETASTDVEVVPNFETGAVSDSVLTRSKSAAAGVMEIDNVAHEEVIELHVDPDSTEDDRQSVDTASDNHPSDSFLTDSENEIDERGETVELLNKPGVSPPVRKVFIGGDYNRLSYVTEAKENLQKLKERLEGKNKMIRSLQQKLRRYKARVQSLETVVAFLREKLRIAEKSKRCITTAEALREIKANKNNTDQNVNLETLLLEKEELKDEVASLKDQNDELRETQINYEALALHNLELQLQIESLKTENQKLKSMLEQP